MTRTTNLSTVPSTCTCTGLRFAPGVKTLFFQRALQAEVRVLHPSPPRGDTFYHGCRWKLGSLVLETSPVFFHSHHLASQPAVT